MTRHEPLAVKAQTAAPRRAGRYRRSVEQAAGAERRRVMDGQFSDDFKAQYPKSYGPTYRAAKPDFTRCAAPVYPRDRTGWGSHQCERKNGHGPHGAWCKAHDPVAKKAKRDAKVDEWMRQSEASQKLHAAKAALEPALRQIAAGHNDPRSLAEIVIAALDDARRPTPTAQE